MTAYIVVTAVLERCRAVLKVGFDARATIVALILVLAKVFSRRSRFTAVVLAVIMRSLQAVALEKVENARGSRLWKPDIDDGQA